MTISTRFCLLFLFDVFSFYALAQKKPNVQAENLYLQSAIKIDGKVDDWNNEFKAYNRSVNLAYTLANDNEYLYLTVQASQPRVIEKILTVGLTLLININNIKNEKDKSNIIISYPIISYRYVHGILVNAGDKANWSGNPIHNSLFVEALSRTDSTVNRANQVFLHNAGTIKVLGLKGQIDTLISIYNEQRIRVAALFDNNGLYSYELSFPLKYLELSNIEKQSFTYEIRLNDWGNPMTNSFSIRDPLTGKLGERLDADQDLNSTTYMWGEYTLAKKP